MRKMAISHKFNLCEYSRDLRFDSDVGFLISVKHVVFSLNKYLGPKFSNCTFTLVEKKLWKVFAIALEASATTTIH